MRPEFFTTQAYADFIRYRVKWETAYGAPGKLVDFDVGEPRVIPHCHRCDRTYRIGYHQCCDECWGDDQ